MGLKRVLFYILRPLTFVWLLPALVFICARLQVGVKALCLIVLGVREACISSPPYLMLASDKALATGLVPKGGSVFTPPLFCT